MTATPDKNSSHHDHDDNNASRSGFKNTSKALSPIADITDALQESNSVYDTDNVSVARLNCLLLLLFSYVSYIVHSIHGMCFFVSIVFIDCRH